MSGRDWDDEIDRAVDWLWEKTVEAVDLTYPPGMLWGASGAGLKSLATANVFKTILRLSIGDQFRESKGGLGVDWDHGEPLRGELLRSVGVNGRFPSPPFLAALRAIGAEDVIPKLSPGMGVTINPGGIVVKADFRDRGSRIEVPKRERRTDAECNQAAGDYVAGIHETPGR